MSDAHYLTPYHESARKHGRDAFGVTLWANPETQQRRFKAFAQMYDLANKRVLDAGCSRGDLAAFLVENQIPYQRYVGIDALCDVIDFAASRGLPNAQFHCGDFMAEPGLLSLGQPQVICISGSLNTMDDPRVFNALESAWAAASQALLFNFLSDHAGPGAPPQRKPARRLDTQRLIGWALSQTWAVAFRQDYFQHGHDATILMQKPDAA